jgi:hypothetical protein
MAVHLDVICEPSVSRDARQSQTIRVIAEVLPFVLAKYGISAVSARCAADGPDYRDASPRFTL